MPRRRPGEPGEGTACGRPCAAYRLGLKDRIGAVHPLRFDARCRCTIFSGHVQSAIDLLPDRRQAGLRYFRVELLDETSEQVRAILDLYSRALAGWLDGADAAAQLAELTAGGVRRGSWDFD